MYALHDPAHVLAPGLFRSLKPGDRKRLKLDVVYDFGDGHRLEFSGPEPLGVDDLRVLQGLVAMAGKNSLVLKPATETESGRELRRLIEPRWEAVREDALVATGSYRALALAIGYVNVDDARTIRACIERLWKVSIIAVIDGKRMGSRLLAGYASAEASIYVALNPRLTRAIVGQGGGRHARIELAEVRGLSLDVARLLHQRLSGWIDAGRTKSVGLDVLVGYAWPDHAEGSTHRMRCKRIRAALDDLGRVGWTILESSKSTFSINRPARARGG